MSGVIFLSLMSSIFGVAGPSTIQVGPTFGPEAAEWDYEIQDFIVHHKREEALKWIFKILPSSKGENRAFLIQKAHVVGCLFFTNKSFEIYQEGHNLMLSKKFKLAREKFEKALSEEPDNLEILTRLGQSLLLEGELDLAILRLSTASTLNPYEAQINLWLGNALLQKKNARSLTELKAAYVELKESEQAVAWYAEALSLFGQQNLALRILTADIKKWPLHVWSMVLLSKISLDSGTLDRRALWRIRKTLQLALSRLDEYPRFEEIDLSHNLAFDVRRSAKDLKLDIQRLLNTVQTKLTESQGPQSNSGSKSFQKQNVQRSRVGASFDEKNKSL